MKISFDRPLAPKSSVLVILLEEGELTKGHAKGLDEAGKGQLARAIKSGAFEGKKEQVLDVLAPGGGLDRVILMGLAVKRGGTVGRSHGRYLARHQGQGGFD
jgi:leucyl aminopeptidase